VKILMTLLGAVALAAPFSPVAANASPYVVMVEQSGLNVVSTGSGVIDTTGLSEGGTSDILAELSGTPAVVVIGPACGSSLTAWSGIVGPGNIGTGGGNEESSGTGVLIGLDASALGILLPVGYAGTNLSDSGTFDGTTLAGLGLTPGNYTWSWGALADQSFTVEIVGTTTTPVPAALPLFAGGIGMIGLLARKRHKAQKA